MCESTRKIKERERERGKEVTSINGRIGLRPGCTLAFRVVSRRFFSRYRVAHNVNAKVRNRSICWSLNDRAKRPLFSARA